MHVLTSQTIGLKRDETGALVKDYSGPESETEQAVQMSLMKVQSEDPRFIEQPAAPLEQEYPVGSNVFFLGEHTYGTPALVKDVANDKASLMIVVSCLVPYFTTSDLIFSSITPRNVPKLKNSAPWQRRILKEVMYQRVKLPRRFV